MKRRGSTIAGSTSLLVIACLCALVPFGDTRGGVYVDVPERLWPDGIVHYTFAKDSSDNEGICEGGDKDGEECDTSNNDDDCTMGGTCIPAPPVRQAGRCVGGTFDELACDLSNNDSDCPGGVCTPVLSAAKMCGAMDVWDAVADLTFIEFDCDGASTCGTCSGGDRDGNGCDVGNGNDDCPGGGTCNSLGYACVDDPPADYVRYRITVNRGSNSDSEGLKQGNLEQRLSIRARTDTINTYGLVHELGHVLAFYHTHQRTDRDDHLRINFCEISSGGVGNFYKASASLHWPRNVMDVDSIMSYGLCIFSICRDSGAEVCEGTPTNCDSICDDQCLEDQECADPPTACARHCSGGCGGSNKDDCATATLLPPYDTQFAFGDVGHRDHLSVWDARLMSFLYPRSNWRFVEQDYTGTEEDGTFHYPYKAFADGESNTPNGGTLWIHPGNYVAVGTHDKPLTLRATIGVVVLDD